MRIYPGRWKLSQCSLAHFQCNCIAICIMLLLDNIVDVNLCAIRINEYFFLLSSSQIAIDGVDLHSISQDRNRSRTFKLAYNALKEKAEKNFPKNLPSWYFFNFATGQHCRVVIAAIMSCKVRKRPRVHRVPGEWHKIFPLWSIRYIDTVTKGQWIVGGRDRVVCVQNVKSRCCVFSKVFPSIVWSSDTATTEWI